MCCFYDFFLCQGLVFLMMNASESKGDSDDFHLASVHLRLVYNQLCECLDQRRNVVVSGRHVFATSLHLIGLVLVHYGCHILFQFPLALIEDCCAHAGLHPMHIMACQLDNDFHLGFPVTWMSGCFLRLPPLRQPHELVMVAIH